jgi:Tol biopolymer transport system component
LTKGAWLAFGDWSADGSYFALKQYDSASSYKFVSARDLQLSRVHVIPYQDVRRPSGDMGDTDAQVVIPPESPAAYRAKEIAWAPHGNRFAYLNQTPKGIDLVIATPDRGIERTINIGPVDKTYPVSRIHWSPDGRYIAIHTREPNAQLPPEYRVTSEWWHLNIFGVDDGAPSYRRIPTEQIIDPASLPEDVGWVGGAWLYRRQQELIDNDPIVDAIVFYPDKNRLEIMAANTVKGIFPNADRRWFAIPIKRSGRVDIDVIDIKGNQRRTLLTGVPSWIERVAWSPDGGAVLTVFSDGTEPVPQYRIAWMQVDSPNGPFTSDTKFSFVENVEWLADRRTALVTSLERNRFSIDAADLRTGKLLPLIKDAAEPGWSSFESRNQVFPSPAGRDVMILAREFSRHKVYIASLDQRITRFVRDNVEVRNPRWSPDGTRLAYLQIRPGDKSAIPALETVSADGSNLHRIELDAKYKNITGWGLRWTWCP